MRSYFNSKKFQLTLIKYSIFLPILTGFIAVLVIFGWIFHLDSLVRIYPQLATMKFNTASCFILLSIASLLSSKFCFFEGSNNTVSLSQNKVIKSIINFLMVLVLIIAVLTLIEYLFNFNIGIDELFIKDTFENTNGIGAIKILKGRMGLNTAICLLILALIQLSLNFPRPNYCSIQLFSLVVFFIALLAFLGLIYNGAYFTNVESYVNMTLSTALNLIMFSLSILFRYPQFGIMKIIVKDTYGGAIARSLLPMIIILSPFLCGLVLIGYQQNLYSIAMGFNLLAITYIITFSFIIWQNSSILDGIDFKRKQAEDLLKKKQQELIKQNESLEILNQQLQKEIIKRQEIEIILRESEAQYLAIIEDQTELICRFLPSGIMLFVNQAYCNYYGIDREKVIGNKYQPVIYSPDLDKIQQMLDSLCLENPVATIEHRAIVQGEIRWMEWTNRAIFDQEGNFIEFQSVGRDIHDRQQAEIKIQQLNEQLQSLLDNAPLSISLFNSKGKYLQVNKTLSQKLNLPSEEIIGKTFQDLFPPSVYNIFQSRLDILKNTLKSIDVEDQIIINNQTKIFRTILFPVLKENNTDQIFWAIAYDITEQKRIEASLRAKTEELDRFFSVAIDLLSISNLEGDFLRVNSQWQKTFDYTIQELEGMRLLNYVHPEDLEKTNIAISTLKNNEPINNFVNRYRCRDGSYRDLEWRSVRVDNLIYSAARDITNRLQVENQLRNYEKIVAGTSDAIALIDKNYIYQVVNEKYLYLHQKSLSEVINHPITDILDPELFANIFKTKVDQCLSGKTINFEIWYDHPITKNQYLSITYSPSYQLDHNISGIVVSIRDITQVKIIEQQIQASLHEKEVLLKEIHHRVKNNLQIIHSLLNLQSRSINNPSISIKFQESQTRIQSMALIHEHLYQSNNFSEINLSEYINELINILFSTYQINTLSIEYQVKVEQNFFLDIDSAVPCGLIINELISNVLKYAFNKNQKGKLFVGITADKENNLVLTVADNGKGLPPDLNWEKSPTLGLKLVKNLIRQLRGNIVLDREEGTKYTITLTSIKGSPAK
ncbi:PAS domain S-box protein [Geminocystis sp. GBBB08]|uniref:PAS domain S-box protein n=1 Tax=Geminocystis sp. GBBB08 TaxID=2604140 RepID=UPI0027E23352|nr:PAS domain S-box protein [Geminocystis sp. GBBB08]MBL1211226.1 PAS domain S-box protein [Geminocystis sp. GBBB08]